MDTFSQEREKKKKITEVKTYPVLYELEEIKENITFYTNTSSKLSKEQIIKQAIQFDLKVNILEVIKCYQYCINKGFNDHLYVFIC